MFIIIKSLVVSIVVQLKPYDNLFSILQLHASALTSVLLLSDESAWVIPVPFVPLAYTEDGPAWTIFAASSALTKPSPLAYFLKLFCRRICKIRPKPPISK